MRFPPRVLRWSVQLYGGLFYVFWRKQVPSERMTGAVIALALFSASLLFSHQSLMSSGITPNRRG